MSKNKIVVVGSLNMDLVVSADRMPKAGETIQGSAIRYVPGGKGANQALCCARLGAETVLIGNVGDDLFGSRLLDYLKNDGVDVRHVGIRPEVPSGIAAITLTKEDNSIVVVPGANALTSPEDAKTLEGVLEPGDIVLLQLEIPLPTVREALRIARAQGAVTVLNPAPYRELDEEMLRLAHYLTPNETELESLIGRSVASDSDLRESLGQWIKDQPSRLIVTRGARGCSYLENGELRTVAPPRVEVVDTVGAGDAFNGGLACGLARGWALEESIRFAIRVSSLAVTKFGAQEGMPTLAEVEAAGRDGN